MTKLWKSYFYLMLFIMVIEFSLRLVVSTEVTGELYLSIRNQTDLLFTVIMFIGLYGFIYKRKIFNKLFWAVFFVILLFYTGWTTYDDMQIDLRIDQMFPEVETSFIEYFLEFLGFALSIPAYIGLFVYSYKSKGFWTNPVEQMQK